MKKILLLMAIILPFVFTSCGDDKDEPKQNLEQELIGQWYFMVNEYTVNNYLFNSDHTGKHWMKQDGEVLNWTVRSFNWSLKEVDNVTYLNITSDEPHSIPASMPISIKDDILYIIQDEGTFEYHRSHG